MADPSEHEDERTAQPRDAAYWSRPVETLNVPHPPSGALNLNVDGRRVVGPLQGFGMMWQKTYRIRLTGSGVTPVELIKIWKERFPEFWPRGNRFYAPLSGIAPGEVALLNSVMPGGIRLSTGVLVLYAEPESFALMTAQGHIFSGWITFSAFREEGEAGCTVAQAQILMRANDPVYEIALRLGGHRQEDVFWQRTLIALAAHFGVNGSVDTQAVCIDRRLQWSNARNIWQNAAIRTATHLVISPVYRVPRLVQRGIRARSIASGTAVRTGRARRDNGGDRVGKKGGERR
jgi:hypothetical protein